MAISQRIVADISRSSWIRKMFEEGAKRKAMYGADKVFDFSLGNPNLEPPAKFHEEIRKLVDDPAPGRHGYMPNAGYPETRQAVAEHVNSYTKAHLNGEDVIMTAGAGGGLNVILKTLLDPGDEVIIPKPYFVEYDFYIDNHQGKPVQVPVGEDFSLDLEAIAAAIGERTKAVLINYPNNPTGRVCSLQELNGLALLLSEHSSRLGRSIYLISDEPYRKIVFDDLEVPSVLDAYRDSLVVTSFSKDLSLPGERIGYIAVNPGITDKELISAGLVLANRILGFVNAPALMQRAIPNLLNQTVDVDAYRRKRDILCEGLAACGYRFVVPKGTFYLFPRTPIDDDVAFVRVLREENILVVPGSGFGGPGHMRIAFCVDDRVVENALPGFERAIKKV
ncbi:MAG TPA: pyridoxal phosphate-dependent aminotransferase [Desulfobacteraceae bacterium]|nr:pyridoxal phosphate-dependent aminotransferase [Desulfobacteraceae bacterium]